MSQCVYPDWEGGLWKGKHSFGRDGFCTTCGESMTQEIIKLRSLEQNKKMWPMLTDISNQVKWPVNGVMVNMSPEDWKHVLSAGFKKEQRVAAGIDGGYVILGQRTSKFSKEEMSEFIELIYAFGANREPPVVWSEPDNERGKL